MTSQQMINYKLIDPKFRAPFKLSTKELLINMCEEQCDKIIRGKPMEAFINNFTSKNDPKEDAIHVIFGLSNRLGRMKVKLLIYAHNGDIRQLIKYYHKYYKLASNVMEVVEEFSEKNNVQEALYIKICDRMADDIEIFKTLCDECIKHL